MQFAELRQRMLSRNNPTRRWRSFWRGHWWSLVKTCWIMRQRSFWRGYWWSFVKTSWLITLNGTMVIFALREGQPVFAALIVVFGGIIVWKEMKDDG